MMAKIMGLFLLGITNWGTEGKSVTGGRACWAVSMRCALLHPFFLFCTMVFWSLNQPLDQ